MSLRFPNEVLADVRLSWLDPVKARRYTVVGSKKMLMYDDIATDKVVIFDKRVEIPPYSDTEQEFHASYFHGDGIPYPINWEEPLKRECQHFINCVQNNSEPLSSARAGLDVVRVIQAADASLHIGCTWVEVSWTSLIGSGLHQM
jgi:predicted dehydrogenase